MRNWSWRFSAKFRSDMVEVLSITQRCQLKESDCSLNPANCEMTGTSVAFHSVVNLRTCSRGFESVRFVFLQKCLTSTFQTATEVIAITCELQDLLQIAF